MFATGWLFFLDPQLSEAREAALTVYATVPAQRYPEGVENTGIKTACRAMQSCWMVSAGQWHPLKGEESV